MSGSLPWRLPWARRRGALRRHAPCCRHHVSSHLPCHHHRTPQPHSPATTLRPTPCSYFIIGYQPAADKFLIFLGVLLILDNVGAGLGLFLGCVFNNLDVALAIVPMLLLPLMVRGGGGDGLPALPCPACPALP